MTSKARHVGFTLAAALAALLLALAVGACGGDDDGEGAAPKGNGTEQAFMEAMIPHHESAIEMAEVAKRRGQHREVKQLANDIVHAQSAEIAQMEQIHKRLFGSEITPDPEAGEQLGLSAEAAGMMHVDVAAELEGAQPFEAQSSEIEEMNDWRTKWYGAPLPAGGVPEPGEDEGLPGEEHQGQGHSG